MESANYIDTVSGEKVTIDMVLKGGNVIIAPLYQLRKLEQLQLIPELGLVYQVKKTGRLATFIRELPTGTLLLEYLDAKDQYEVVEKGDIDIRPPMEIPLAQVIDLVGAEDGREQEELLKDTLVRVRSDNEEEEENTRPAKLLRVRGNRAQVIMSSSSSSESELELEPMDIDEPTVFIEEVPLENVFVSLLNLPTSVIVTLYQRGIWDKLTLGKLAGLSRTWNEKLTGDQLWSALATIDMPALYMYFIGPEGMYPHPVIRKLLDGLTKVPARKERRYMRRFYEWITRMGRVQDATDFRYERNPTPIAITGAKENTANVTFAWQCGDEMFFLMSKKLEHAKTRQGMFLANIPHDQDPFTELSEKKRRNLMPLDQKTLVQYHTHDQNGFILVSDMGQYLYYSLETRSYSMLDTGIDPLLQMMLTQDLIASVHPGWCQTTIYSRRDGGAKLGTYMDIIAVGPMGPRQFEGLVKQGMNYRETQDDVGNVFRDYMTVGITFSLDGQVKVDWTRRRKLEVSGESSVYTIDSNPCEMIRPRPSPPSFLNGPTLIKALYKSIPTDAPERKLVSGAFAKTVESIHAFVLFHRNDLAKKSAIHVYFPSAQKQVWVRFRKSIREKDALVSQCISCGAEANVQDVRNPGEWVFCGAKCFDKFHQ